MEASTHTLSIAGLDAIVTITPATSCVNAYGIAFDEDASIIAETESRRFIDFCYWEIVYQVASDLVGSRRQIEYGVIADAVSEIIPACECDN